MSPAVASATAREWLVLVPARGRVLLLGAARGLAAELRSHDLDPAPVDDPETYPFPEGSFDAAFVMDALERLPWDRWTLQKVHRALRPDGVLGLTADNMFSLAGPDDLVFWGRTMAKQVSLEVGRRMGRSHPPRRFSRRKYRPAALRSTLESLGFGVESWRDRGDGFLGAGRGRFTPGWSIVARRLPSLPGLGPGRPYPDSDSYRRRFEASRGGFIGVRDAWAARHPGWISPPQSFPIERHAGAPVLVLAPHPDDELIGCGGTVARLAAGGSAVTVIQATDGCDAASLLGAPDPLRRTVRVEEALAVGKAAGYREVIAWREPNDAFRLRDDLVERLAETITRLRPGLVFVPFVTDVHPDHVTLARALMAALRRLGPLDLEVLSYEVWGLVPANAWVDVTAEMPRLERLLWTYETAMKVDDYVHFSAERNLYNSIALAGRPGYAEAFHVAASRRYPDLEGIVEARS